jgi:hypothetical protein
MTELFLDFVVICFQLIICYCDDAYCISISIMYLLTS